MLDIAGSDAETPLAVMQIARRTDDRYRDLSEKLRREAIDFLEDAEAPAHFLELVRTAGAWTRASKAWFSANRCPRDCVWRD